MNNTKHSRPLNILVLCGGLSQEHEVSLVSARAIVAALESKPANYRVTLGLITKHGRWTSGKRVRQLFDELAPYSALDPIIETEPSFVLPPQRKTMLVVEGQQGVTETPIDVVFPILHGPNGEDGVVQGALELSSIPYIGSPVAASAVGMDKAFSKAIFEHCGLPQLPYTVVNRRNGPLTAEQCKAAIDHVELPCFIKPANMGSSVGVHRVSSAEELFDAINDAFRFDDKIVVEMSAGNCREIECSVLEYPQLRASDVGEIVLPVGRFYDYAAKYLDDVAHIVMPAELSPKTRKKIRGLAISAFRAVGARDLARIDFFVSHDESAVWINEINTMPGFTPISMFAKLWEHSGISFSDLVDTLVASALSRCTSTAL